MNPSVRARLTTQHHAIPFLIDGLTPAELRERPAPETWSIAENMAHLGRYQEIFPQRIACMLAEDIPAFERYRAENDDGFAVWAAREPAEIVAGIEQGRGTIVGLLDGLTDEQQARRGRHPLLGAAAIPMWTEFFLLHEAHHLYTIMKLARRMMDEKFKIQKE